MPPVDGPFPSVRLPLMLPFTRRPRRVGLNALYPRVHPGLLPQHPPHSPSPFLPVPSQFHPPRWKRAQILGRPGGRTGRTKRKGGCDLLVLVVPYTRSTLLLLLLSVGVLVAEDALHRVLRSLLGVAVRGRDRRGVLLEPCWSVRHSSTQGQSQRSVEVEAGANRSASQKVDSCRRRRLSPRLIPLNGAWLPTLTWRTPTFLEGSLGHPHQLQSL